MFNIVIKTEQEEIRDRSGNNVIGRWLYNKSITVSYDPIADKEFIDSCEQNDDGTYHIVAHVNHYVEWVQLCPAYGLWLNVTTIDNLPDDGLYFKGQQVLEMDGVELHLDV